MMIAYRPRNNRQEVRVVAWGAREPGIISRPFKMFFSPRVQGGKKSSQSIFWRQQTQIVEIKIYFDSAARGNNNLNKPGVQLRLVRKISRLASSAKEPKLSSTSSRIGIGRKNSWKIYFLIRSQQSDSLSFLMSVLWLVVAAAAAQNAESFFSAAKYKL